MKKLAAIFTALIILGLSGALAVVMQAGARKLPVRQYFPSNNNVAVWDWHDPAKRSSDDLKQLNDFFYLHQINTVYLDISSYADIYKSNNQPQKQKLQNAIANYVNATKSRGIKIYAAAGNTDWSKPDQRYIPLAIQKFVFDYNNSHPKSQLSGLEFDIESYNQAGFPQSSNTEKSITLSELLNTVKQLSDNQQNYLKQSHSNLVLGFAIPYWFDNENGNIPSITWDGKTGPTLYHLADTLNELPQANIVVMAYRNAAAGNDGSIFHSRTEVEYAQTKDPHVKVLVGQEVNDVQPSKITFYGMTLSEMSTEVSLISDVFQQNSSYGGIAINDLAALQQMDKTYTDGIVH
jgi:hypothetical protein